MNKTEIKKALYKQKPDANFAHIKNGIAYYNTTIKVYHDDEEKMYDSKNIFFEIPVDDMGDAPFFKVMPAKLLIRWIVEIE